MPPRSLCLNVFTTSLGNGVGFAKEKELGVKVSEMDKTEGVDGPVAERGRHDSVQGSPNDSIATTPADNGAITIVENTSPTATADVDITTLPPHMGSSPLNEAAHDGSLSMNSQGMMPTVCSTCAQPPAPGLSLLRCSRCKNTYYCSKICQKTAWKQHKYDCERVGTGSSPSPHSALHTPYASTPASPVADDPAAPQNNEP